MGNRSRLKHNFYNLGEFKMKTTFKNIFTVLFALFILASCSSCSNNNENDSEFSEEGEDAENQIQAVRVEDLITSDLRKFIELNGNVRAEKSMSVYPIMAGKIAGTNIRLGSKVKKGAVIAYVDPSVPGSRFALNEVIAPISGTVISTPLKEGTRVSTETAVTTIGDLSKLQVVVNIPERYVSFLKKGLQADVFLEAYPDKKFSAVVSEISPVLDEATRTKEVLLSFTKMDNRINAGMFADVKLYLKKYAKVFSVPTSCIIEKAGEKFVYAILENEPNIAHITPIKAGEEIQDKTIVNFIAPEIIKALDESNVKVVVQGIESLQDGSNVNVAK